MNRLLSAPYYVFSPAINIIRLNKKLNKGSLPRIFIFAVTYKCNSKCSTCSIWKRYLEKGSLAKKELSIGEIQNFLDSPILKKLKAVNLTGGEPFLRNDLVELIKAFESDKIREILEDKLGYNEYIIEDIQNIIGSYIQDFKEDLD